ncbi:MAG: glycosyltransferase family 4 protein, partial [Gammaproteobacteria bacterium]|nr:glycosyltransferase family 4 protein [Gammaproteobacteria bacterium]
REIHKHKLAETVLLLGNRSDIPDILGQSHLFLMSSAWEGLPISLIEATLSGLPCIVTDVGGCSEVIDTCQNGVVVESGNPQALADAITRILSNPDLYSKLSANALARSGAFTIGAACSGHIRLYQELLRHSTKAG